MKVKATTTFAGRICMAAGEVGDVPEDIAASLLKCGYLVLLQDGDSSTPLRSAQNDSVLGLLQDGDSSTPLRSAQNDSGEELLQDGDSSTPLRCAQNDSGKEQKKAKKRKGAAK